MLKMRKTKGRMLRCNVCNAKRLKSWEKNRWHTDYHLRLNKLFLVHCQYFIILGDPGAVRVGRKGTDSQRTISKIQADAGSWLGTKNALYYCAQSANSFSWVLFVSLYTTPIVSPHLPGSITKLVGARETFIFYFPNWKRRNYRWVGKKFGICLLYTSDAADE